MLKFFCKIIKFLYKYNMLKYIINLLIKICLINIFTIKIFSQNCCDECFENCKKILHKENDNNSDLDNNNSDLNNKNDNSNLNNNLDLDDNSDLDNNQKEYFKSLLKDFDKNIKNFNNSIFSENLGFTEAEYTIVKEGTKGDDGILGKGSYGTVYKVKNKKGKFFALKKAFIPESEDEATKKEIQILIKCRDCKNVIKIVDTYKDTCKYNFNSKNGYYYYIVTELYQGGDLNDFIEKCKTNTTGLDYNEIRKKKDIYIYQMINAVKQIHDKGIIHRDIKPANFFIGEDDKLYLGDFGIAIENYNGIYLIGSPFYMYFFLNYMVEFMKGKQNIVNSLLKHCDLYSLMCTIFELLEHTYFANYSGNFNVLYQDLFNGSKLFCPKMNFNVPNDIINKIISGQNGLLQQIQNNQNTNFFYQKQLKPLETREELNKFSFSPLKRWSNYLVSNKIDINKDRYANMLNEIIQNLFITNFNIDSILETTCYKTLDNLYKKNY